MQLLDCGLRRNDGVGVGVLFGGHVRSLTAGLWPRKASIMASALSGDGMPRARASSLLSMMSWPRLL